MTVSKNLLAAAAVCLVVGGVGGAALTYQLSQRNIVPSASAEAAAPGADPGSASAGTDAAAPPYQGSVSPVGEDIGAEGAKAAALLHAGLSAEAVSALKVESDWDQGRLEYEVDFRSGGTEYEYVIDGATGSVLKCQQEAPAVQSAPAGSGDIGVEAAQAAALSHAGLAADAVSGLTARSDREDNRPVYEVDFWTAEKEYEYTIEAATGKVLEVKREDRAPASSAAPANGDIGAEGAKAAALADAGLLADRVTGLTVESDWEDGRLEYEVEFWSGDSEYEYVIDGATGGVLEYKKEARLPAAGGGYIGEDAAGRAALAHAGVGEVTGYSCYLAYDGGTPHCYQVEFTCGDYCYDYRIGLYDGAVLNHGCRAYQTHHQEGQGHHGGHHW